jgi:ABC-2 type transport system ATP-binding protein/teichoic acid transport system ATP-binding protein
VTETKRLAPPAISVENVSLMYRTTFERVPTFKSAIVRFGRGERAVKEVHAVQDVSFEVPHGTTLGIIGANGAGKSTLMRMLAGILPPTTGRVTVRGKVSTLLSLGVGFNPQLSGRENVILGGLAMGMSRKEITERYEEIAEFAEIGEFIDMPMRTYSSGMYSRLAFAVSVHMDPDILLVDEALSAGDATFKEKAAAKMQELMDHASTMCLVSHALGTIKTLCTHAIWMHKGKLMLHDETSKVIEQYNTFLKVGESAFTLEDF